MTSEIVGVFIIVNVIFIVYYAYCKFDLWILKFKLKRSHFEYAKGVKGDLFRPVFGITKYGESSKGAEKVSKRTKIAYIFASIFLYIALFIEAVLIPIYFVVKSKELMIDAATNFAHIFISSEQEEEEQAKEVKLRNDPTIKELRNGQTDGGSNSGGGGQLTGPHTDGNVTYWLWMPNKHKGMPITIVMPGRTDGSTAERATTEVTERSGVFWGVEEAAPASAVVFLRRNGQYDYDHAGSVKVIKKVIEEYELNGDEVYYYGFSAGGNGFSAWVKEFEYTGVILNDGDPGVAGSMYNSKLKRVAVMRAACPFNLSAYKSALESKIDTFVSYDFGGAGHAVINFWAGSVSMEHFKTAPYYQNTISKEPINALVWLCGGSVGQGGDDADGPTMEHKEGDIVLDKEKDLVYRDGIFYVHGIMLANKTFPLPKNYNPGRQPEAEKAFNEMKKAGIAAGFSTEFNADPSWFRDYNLQQTLYNNYVSRDGKAAADTYSARPGHSEHQTGYALDVWKASRTVNGSAPGEFKYPVFKWIDEHAHEYGFIVRYRGGTEGPTGYVREDWHIRWVGKEWAKKLHDANKSIEEYFGLTSSYDDTEKWMNKVKQAQNK